jgi:beta-fructofuranosidase
MRYSNPAIEKAMSSLDAARPKAEADPDRPVYHFRPPANWMNDPNGTIFHKGYYHLFYQHNPYGDAWGHMHWGHARSTDLVYWEHLPIALWPSLEAGEGHCYSGCAWINGQGQPMLFYTSVSPAEGAEEMPNQQWAALSDDAMLTWQKHPANPILSLDTHGGPPFEGPWRDPFIFEEAGRVFMVIGASTESEATVALYEAEDDTLARWAYRGLLIQRPKESLQFFECPNFFKLGDKWLLLTSPYRPVEYYVGLFDVEALKFEVEGYGILDYGSGKPEEIGYGSNAEYYATNILWDNAGPDGQKRCILLGWVRGFKPERGWNGCLALPRVLSIGADGRPRQTPLPELQRLRGQSCQLSDVALSDGLHILDIAGDTLEIQAQFELDRAGEMGLQVRRSEDGERAVAISYDGQTLNVAGTVIPYPQEAGESTLRLHLFVDKSVLEVFVNDGQAAITRVIYPPAADLGVAVYARGEQTRLSSLHAWQMTSIWAT